MLCCAKSLQSCPTLCDPVDRSPPGSSVCGILQAGVLEWVAIPFSRGPSRLRDRTCMFYVSLQCQAGSLLLVPPGKPKKHSQKIVVVELISCVQVFCDPMDCSPPGSSVHGIPQARILERVAISFSRGSSQPRDQTYISCIAGRFFATEPPGKPGQKIKTLKTLSLRFDSAQRLSSEIQSQMLYSSLGSPCLAGFRENQVAFLVSSCVIT